MPVFDPGNMQGEHSYSGYGAYARSKLFNIMFTIDLATSVRLNSLDPGVISTKLLHAGWALAGDEVSVGGEEVYETVMEIARHGWNGEYFENLRPVPCSSIAKDSAARQELCERRCGSAADEHASLLAGAAVRCSRLMAWRVSAGTESGWKFAAQMARRIASEPSDRGDADPVRIVRRNSYLPSCCQPLVFSCPLVPANPVCARNERINTSP
jgi:hypothetical protein